MMVSNISYVHPYLGKIPILTNIFQRGWFNHQTVIVWVGIFHHDFTSRISDSHSEYWNRLGDLFTSGVNGEFKSSSLGGYVFTSSKPLFSKSNVVTS